MVERAGGARRSLPRHTGAPGGHLGWEPVIREVLGPAPARWPDLRRRRRAASTLGGCAPEEVVRERLGRDTSLANPAYRPPAAPCVLPKAMLVVARANELSQPDTI
jgi:hypothetical protein